MVVEGGASRQGGNDGGLEKGIIEREGEEKRE